MEDDDMNREQKRRKSTAREDSKQEKQSNEQQKSRRNTASHRKMSNAWDPKKDLTKKELLRLVAFSEKLSLRNTDSGNPHSFTPEELQWLDDACLIRYLRARDWNIDNAEKMILESIEWRRTYKPHEIKLTEVIEVLKLKGLFSCGVDKQGLLVESAQKITISTIHYMQPHC